MSEPKTNQVIDFPAVAETLPHAVACAAIAACWNEKGGEGHEGGFLGGVVPIMRYLMSPKPFWGHFAKRNALH